MSILNYERTVNLMVQNIIRKPIFIISSLALLLNILILVDLLTIKSIINWFSYTNKYRYFYIVFLVYVSFIYFIFLIFVYKYHSVKRKSKDNKYFVYTFIIALSLCFSLGMILLIIIAIIFCATIYSYFIDDVSVTFIGTIHMVFLTAILFYQSIYFIKKINSDIYQMVTQNEKEVNKFFSLGLKILTLISVLISVSKHFFNSGKESFGKHGKVPDFIIGIISYTNAIELISWGATITFLSIEIFIINKKDLKNAITKWLENI